MMNKQASMEEYGYVIYIKIYINYNENYESHWPYTDSAIKIKLGE